MKSTKYIDENGIEMEYILSKANAESKTLVVAFPGPDGEMRGGEWGYLVTLKKIADVNTLFLKTKTEYARSNFTMINGKPLIDEAIFNLVDSIAKEIDTDNIIAIGTSMGGYAALYFGLKYNWNIISGSPDYTFYEHSDYDIFYATGEKSVEAKEYMNNLLLSIIKLAGDRGYDKKCFISWGEGERIWKREGECQKMIRDLEENHISHSYALYPFSDHLTCAELFPQTLERYLKYYMGLSEKPLENDVMSLPPQVKMYKKIQEAYKKILEVIEPFEKIIPNLDIKNNIIYGYNDDGMALRNYVYVKEGWFWSVGEAYKWAGGEMPNEPVKIKKYFDPTNINNDKTILSFYFQSTLLQWYKRQPNDAVLRWLLLNFVEYIRTLPNISTIYFDYVHQKPFDHVIRMLYFIELHKYAVGHVDEAFERAISNEVIKSLKCVAEQGVNPIPIRWQYRMVLGLLVVAMYYKGNKLNEVVYLAAMDIFNALNEFHFDRNGLCISEQMDSQDFFMDELKSVMDFIALNEMEKTKGYQRAKRIYNKVAEVVSHICQPDGRLPALGHTGFDQMSMCANNVKHSPSNFIKRTSNIAFLEDEKSISFISINGGSNVHSQHRHCDLLSFTWNYDGVQVFCDAGGVGLGNVLEEYVSSCVAHNGFICNNINYVTPDYEDWTAIDENIDEREDCVIIPCSHNLIEGVILNRKFFWIKPNILILIDYGSATEVKDFTQNFLLHDLAIEKNGSNNSLLLRVSSSVDGKIVQHYGNEEIKFEEYRGANEFGDGNINLRGTIAENWQNPRRGLSLVYTKNEREVKFVTSIELHSKNRTGEEQKIQSVNFDVEGNLIIVLGDGKVIFEKK